MGFQTDYENAERVLLVDFDSGRDTLGRKLMRLLPFQFVIIGGKSYIETMNEPEDLGLAKYTGGAFNQITRLQDASEGNSVSYNGSVPPTFEKSLGV